MKLKNEDENFLYFYSKLGRKIGKQNLLLYRWEHKKNHQRPSTVSPALSKIKYLYKINQLKNDKKYADEDNDIFSIEVKDKQKLENMTKDLEDKKENKNDEKIKDKNNKKNISKKMSHKSYFKKKEETKDKSQPSCTKYNPKYDIIFRRSASSPSFKTMLGRKSSNKIDETDFYLKQNLIGDTMAGKTFIDFSKQIRKKSIFDIEGEKSMNKSTKHKSVIIINKEHYFNNKNQSSLNINKSNSKNTKSKNTINQNNNNNNSEILNTNNSNDSFDLFRHIYISKIKKKKNKNKIIMDKGKKKESSIKSVDFNQMISREDLEKLQSKQISICPYLFPNYSLVRDRPIMMVLYEKKDIKPNKSRSDYAINSYNVSNIDKSMNKLHTPNFKLMNSRPCDENDPYPSFMKGVYNKNNCFQVSSESLKAVNSSNSKMLMPLSTLWRNNSFNKYTNLKMIKAHKNLIDYFLNNDKLELDIKTKKLMNFYKQNYKDFIGGKNKLNNLENNIFREALQRQEEDKNIKDLIKELRGSINIVK